MSTRSIILVTGKPTYNGDVQTIRLYKHSDGYPTGNLPIIRDALKRALKQGAEHAKRFKETEPRPLVPEQVAGFIIGESTTEYGFGAKIDAYESDDAIYYKPVVRETLGDQQDLEWIYIVDLKAKTLTIHSGCQDSVVEGCLKDPELYANQLYEQYRAEEIKETRRLIKDIEGLGFNVNKTQPKGPTKAKPKKSKLSLAKGA